MLRGVWQCAFRFGWAGGRSAAQDERSAPVSGGVCRGRVRVGELWPVAKVVPAALAALCQPAGGCPSPSAALKASSRAASAALSGSVPWTKSWEPRISFCVELPRCALAVDARAGEERRSGLWRRQPPRAQGRLAREPLPKTPRSFASGAGREPPPRGWQRPGRFPQRRSRHAVGWKDAEQRGVRASAASASAQRRQLASSREPPLAPLRSSSLRS